MSVPGGGTDCGFEGAVRWARVFFLTIGSMGVNDVEPELCFVV